MNFVLAFIYAFCFTCYSYSHSTANIENLKVVIIRHAEKPLKGDNLTCQGLNRSLKLPAILYAKFGIPKYIYVPSVALDKSTKHSRMFETVVPLAIKYNLSINSKYDEMDSTGVVADLKNKEGTVIVVWQHRIIPSIVRAFCGNDFNLTWDDDDFDSIWIITFPKGIAAITKDKEGIVPKLDCPD